MRCSIENLENSRQVHSVRDEPVDEPWANGQALTNVNHRESMQSLPTPSRFELTPC